MNVACLTSGGKDSLYACYIAIQYGWNIKCLISVFPKKLSWMYHMENIHLMPLIAKAMKLPLIARKSEANKEEELEDLKKLIEKANVEGIISGAIASEYQRTRIEKICHELEVKSFTPIWHKKQDMLLKDLIDADFNIIITAVASMGFDKKWLGRRIDERSYNDLKKLEKKYGINIAGEGGEYETFVLDCPLYKKRIEIIDAEIKWDGHRGIYEIKKAKLTNKLSI